MEVIEVASMPRLRFAHIYSSKKYSNFFSPLENFLEISYLQKGSLDFDDGVNKYTAEKDDITCIFRKKPLSISADNFHCHHTVGINLKIEYTDNSINGLFLPPVTPARLKTAEVCRQIDWFIHNVAICDNSPTKSAAKILEMLCTIDKINRDAMSDNVPNDSLYVYRAKKYISKNICEPIMQKDVAKHLGVTPGYLCSIFKKSEGTTLMKYINSEKLKGVKSLIETKNIPLYEAATMYGYSDPNYVSRLYKKMFGFNITDVPNKR